jgi:hypothetical protein
MARPQTVHGLKPDATVRANAQKIVATRTAEFFGFAPYLANPAYATQLHDMRIAAKRLRYTLEIFAPALGPGTRACTEVVKEFQEMAGQIHDDDVLLDVIREQVVRRATDTATALADLALGNADDPDSAKAKARAFVTDTAWVAEQAALAAMMARTAGDRQERFARLQAKWEEWRAAGLRERLEALTVDLPADVIPAPRAPAPAQPDALPANAPTDDAPTVAPGLGASVNGGAPKQNGKRGRRGLIPGALRRPPKR